MRCKECDKQCAEDLPEPCQLGECGHGPEADLHPDYCWGTWGGECEPIDWRARALKAEAELAALKEGK